MKRVQLFPGVQLYSMRLAFYSPIYAVERCLYKM